jgi:hypothetical protein
LKTVQIQIQTMPLQVPPQIPSPLPKLLPFCNFQKITNKNSHNKIILFSNNSFAILGIPYPKMISSSSLRKRKALNEIKSALSSEKSQKPSLALLESNVAMPTKLNREASQEPESWCIPCQLGSHEGQTPTHEISPSKSLNLFPLTNLHMPALPNPSHQSITSGNSTTTAVLPKISKCWSRRTPMLRSPNY